MSTPEAQQTDFHNGRAAEVAQLYHKFMQGIPDVTTMPADTLWHLIQDKDANVVVVDVRDAAEAEVSLLPGPTITKAEFEASPDQYKGRQVVCYCTVGLRSAKYASELLKKGYNAQNLEGSILGWTHKGYPLVLPQDRTKGTKRVHVWGPRFALQPEGYEAIVYPKSVSSVAQNALATFFIWVTGALGRKTSTSTDPATPARQTTPTTAATAAAESTPVAPTGDGFCSG